ncbi:MAG: DUF1566 domain-containing protein [Sandaracinaceae bacterium]|nr:DUF1566 domain-containing protein [Sandaracinaceae bacterium]
MKRPTDGARAGSFLWMFTALSACAGGGPGAECVNAVDCGEGLLCVDWACTQVASVDRGGVYVDPETGLEWQRSAPGETMSWDSAVAYCADLVLHGGGWRLPSVSELRSLIRGCEGTETGGGCLATDTCLAFESCLTAPCDGCAPNAGPSDGCYRPEELEGSCSWYWTSSPLAEHPDQRAWYVIFDQAHVCGRSKDFAFGAVRCVR